MATHDYVIANGTGSAVRSDLNNALAAIVSNNSSSSEPATKYAYQWWADTTTGQLKLRNSANNAWITIFELDGTMLMEDGTVSAPGLAFASDLNTGFFSGGADKLNFATGGVERLEIGSSEVVFNDGSNDVDFRVESNGQTHMLFVDAGNDRVGIGTSSPQTVLQANGVISSTGGTGNLSVEGAYMYYASNEANFLSSGSSANRSIVFSQYNGSVASERARIDSSGNVGIGTTTPAGKLTLKTTNSNGAPSAWDASYFVISEGDTNTSFGLGLSLDTTNNEAHISSLIPGSQWEPINYRASQHKFFVTDASSNEVMRLDSSGDVQIGTTAPYGGNVANRTHLTLNGTNDVKFQWGIGGTERGLLYADATNLSLINTQNGYLRFYTNNAERMRITSGGSILIGKTTVDFGTQGNVLSANGSQDMSRDSNALLFLNRLSNDGNLIQFHQDGNLEGSISVSGSAVSYNGGHLSRWSQLPSGVARTEILRGSVLSNLDEMCEWGEENNEQLNRMKVSDVEGDRNVAGVFQAWDDDDDTYTNDFYCAMTGDFVIRIAQGTTVARGDLLMSAGDGTAKPQDDDIVRSKTIAKVTSTTVSETYSDNSYCVPCVLMAC